MDIVRRKLLLVTIGTYRVKPATRTENHDYHSWATKFIIVLREETATKLSETLNNGSKKLEEGINDTANIKEALMDKLEED